MLDRLGDLVRLSAFAGGVAAFRDRARGDSLPAGTPEAFRDCHLQHDVDEQRSRVVVRPRLFRRAIEVSEGRGEVLRVAAGERRTLRLMFVSPDEEGAAISAGIELSDPRPYHRVNERGELVLTRGEDLDTVRPSRLEGRHELTESDRVGSSASPDGQVRSTCRWTPVSAGSLYRWSQWPA